ncbi:pyruvate dehydrogenase (acetyl-transferring), homodimeric type [Acidothermaceae bacterium B102]|nr:pyruvate dehydrogenase (acetyl-transferring), homodimeric type [Acidothermaceae bacterium B102]
MALGPDPATSGKQSLSALTQIPDVDPSETEEWRDSLDAVIAAQGEGRARYLMLQLLDHAKSRRVGVPEVRTTDYINTIPAAAEPDFPGDEELEERIRSIVRWNAAIMVTRANKTTNVGGHIATFAGAAELYEIGWNHFFRGKDADGDSGDQVYYQGHASPGMYSRAFLEGRLTADQLDGFRQELSRDGLSSYPHPRLMPDFWEFPTVSMGIGPISSIYQARFNRYLTNRAIKDVSSSHVWAFLGDGEMDEVESLGALNIASRENLDNLTWIVNCNLQRLDGPVRGNGKIMQELEGSFRGAGWNVIKLVWDRKWDALLAKDVDGVLVNALTTVPDGQWQTYSTSTGAYIRNDFFGRDPRLLAMVEHLSDEEIVGLGRGGHDAKKVYAAYKAARDFTGAPSVILVQTVKGWTLGPNFEARNATHQMKKLHHGDLAQFRDRLGLPITDEELDADLPPYYHPGPDSPEVQYALARRAALGGSLPKRLNRAKPLVIPHDNRGFTDLRKGSGKQKAATTMTFVRLLKDLMRDKTIGNRIVPVIPDEARTFGIDAMFPSAKIYNPHGQTYEPVDHDLLLSYRENVSGQILHEGINEAGSMASVIAAGSSYATHGEHMIPVFVFYSMFGFQRVGDMTWAMADQLARGFLLGATAGRTTLNGEGLQHEDGHSLLLSATNPACLSYDPAFGFEISYIVEEGLDRMYGERDEAVYYYLTVYNEAIAQPAEPEVEGLREGILRGLYRYKPAEPVADDDRPRVQVLSSGTGIHWALKAQQLLADDWGVAADVWSATSWTELRRDGEATDEWNRLHPDDEQRVAYVTQCLESAPGPVVAVSDWMKAVSDQISPWVPQGLHSLGADGFGRSDTRPALRRFFKVDAESTVLASLTELARRGEVKHEVLAEAIAKYGLNGPITAELAADADSANEPGA